jgi:ribosomal protein S18 acetylase RimI-like enzyme
MVDVRLARATDIAAVGNLFARAFADDPVSSCVTPDATRRERVLARLNAAIVRFEGIPRGATYVAENAGRIVGAAIWQPPRPLPPNLRSLPFSLVAGFALGRDMGRMIAMGRAVSRARPRRRHWYLQLLGVDPVAQRSGVGKALVRAQLSLVDRQGLPAYLETTVENLAFYEGLGFRVAGEIAIHPSAPTEYSLVRDTG